MRIIVTSDSHGRRSALFDIIEKHIEEAETFLNLGDCNSLRDFEDAAAYYGSRLSLHCVAGNCDWSSDLPYEREITLASKKIVMCHGHLFRVKAGLSLYMQEAKRKGADIALFGHTHTPFNEYSNGIHFFNPGAVMDSSYGIIDIADAGIICIHAKI